MDDLYHVKVKVLTSQGVLEECWVTTSTKRGGKFIRATFTREQAFSLPGRYFYITRVSDSMQLDLINGMSRDSI